MADRDNRGNRNPAGNQHGNFTREKRWYGTGYWTNEPDFIEARRQAAENQQRRNRQQARSYDEDEVQSYREEAVDQWYTDRNPQFDRQDFDRDEYYQNRGWTRTSAVERPRDWGYEPTQNFTRSERLEVPYEHSEYWRSWANPRRHPRNFDPNESMRGPWFDEESFARGEDRWRDLDYETNRDQEENYVRNQKEYRRRWRQQELNAYERSEASMRNRNPADRSAPKRFPQGDVNLERGHNRQRGLKHNIDLEEKMWSRRDANLENFEGGRTNWQTPGPYTGVGPQDYRRSDESIQEEICERLTQHGKIDSSGIEVAVQDGTVTLRGAVDRRKEKWMAEDIAGSVFGVEDIQNKIRVSPNDGVRVRGMGRENVVMPGRIQEGMRVRGSQGNTAGQVKEVYRNGFILQHRQNNQEVFIPFDAVQRTDGEIVLDRPASQLQRQKQ